MMHNDALINSIAHKMATNNYYVNNAQPAVVNGITPALNIPLQTAQIFGYNTNEQRFANTISNIIPATSPSTMTQLAVQNHALHSIMPQPSQSVEQFTTTSNNDTAITTPNEKPIKPDPVPEVIPQHVQQDPDTIVVNKSTVVIIISIVVAFIIIQIWMRQRRLEQLMLAQLHRTQIQPTLPAPAEQYSSVPYE